MGCGERRGGFLCGSRAVHVFLLVSGWHGGQIDACVRTLLVQRFVLIPLLPPPENMNKKYIREKKLLIGINNKRFAVYCNDNNRDYEAKGDGDELKDVIRSHFAGRRVLAHTDASPDIFIHTLRFHVAL